MKLNAIIETTADGLHGYIEQDIVSGAAFGNTLSEIKNSFDEIINYQRLYFIEKNDLNKAELLNKPKIVYYFDIHQFFQYFKLFNKTELAKYLGINESLFRQYTKGLVPISKLKLSAITSGMHKLAKELEQINLA